MNHVLSLQMLGTEMVDQTCGQSNVSCNSNQSCLSQQSSAAPNPGGGTTPIAW